MDGGPDAGPLVENVGGFGWEAVEHCRYIGDVTPIGAREPLYVEVVQREELNLTGDPAFLVRGTPQIRFAGVRLNPDQARDLAARASSTTLGPDSALQFACAPVESDGGAWLCPEG